MIEYMVVDLCKWMKRLKITSLDTIVRKQIKEISSSTWKLLEKEKKEIKEENSKDENLDDDDEKSKSGEISEDDEEASEDME